MNKSLVFSLLMFAVPLVAMEYGNNDRGQKRSGSEIEHTSKKEKKNLLNPICGYSVRQGKRGNMEDAHVALHPFGKHNNHSFFAIYDGHGGTEAATCAAQILHQNVLHEIDKNQRNSAEELLTQAFESTEQALKQRKIDSGTTAAVAFAENNILHVAWVGDTRALVIRGNNVVLATQDHKPDAPAEKARVEKAGGKVAKFGSTWRVPGMLAISRSLGDFDVKDLTPGGVVATPEIAQTELQDNDILIIACDGFWDVISNEQAANLVNQLFKKDISALNKQYPHAKHAGEITEEGGNEQMKLISRALRDEAYNRGSSDNISVMVIQFKSAQETNVISESQKPALYQENIMGFLESFRDSLINAEEKEAVSTIQELLKKWYTKDTLNIANEQLEALKQSKIVFFGEPGIAKELVESLQRMIAKDMTLLS